MGQQVSRYSEVEAQALSGGQVDSGYASNSSWRRTQQALTGSRLEDWLQNPGRSRK